MECGDPSPLCPAATMPYSSLLKKCRVRPPQSGNRRGPRRGSRAGVLSSPHSREFVGFLEVTFVHVDFLNTEYHSHSVRTAIERGGYEGCILS